MTISRKSLFSTLGSLALALTVSGVALAQDSTPTNGMDKMGNMGAMHSGMKGMHGNMMGMHMMSATVTEADAKTGIVNVTTDGMALKVHFPPSAMSDLKAGDKITEDIRLLLAERPDARGLAVPGMPMGSPGMEMGAPERYDILLIGRDGSTRVFASHGSRT